MSGDSGSGSSELSSELMVSVGVDCNDVNLSTFCWGGCATSTLVSWDHLDGIQVSWALMRQPEYVVSSSSLYSVCSVFFKFEIKTISRS